MPKKKYFSDEERKAAVRAANKRYRENLAKSNRPYIVK